MAHVVEEWQMWRALEFVSKKLQAVALVFVAFVMVHEKAEVQLVLVETVAVLVVMMAWQEHSIVELFSCLNLMPIVLGHPSRL